MRINLGEDEQPEIGLIALIDCIFFLLMFFMVATSFKHQTDSSKTKELPLVLPAASASLERTSASETPFVIGVDQRGGFYAQGEKISAEALHQRLQKEAASNPARAIRIDGDQLASYQHIVRALDICQVVGLTHISMHTRN